MFFVTRCNKKIVEMVLILSLAGSVAGCGASSDEKQVDKSESGTSPATEIQVNYEVPTQTPNILVDQVGYKPDAEKVAVFKGKQLPETFSVIDEETGKVVFTGDVVKSILDQNTNEYTGQGYFTGLRDEGRYYIYADILGESYGFSISENVYNDIALTAGKKFYINRCGLALSESCAGENAHSACHTTMAHMQEDNSISLDVTGGWHMDEQADRDATLGCKIAENMLLAYEMNPEAFSDDTGIPESGNGVPDVMDEVRYEVEWLLKMQDSKTGGVYGAAVTDRSKGGETMTYPVFVSPVSMDATIGFASMLARFSYLYQQYDSEFATTCLKAADRAWSCYLNNASTHDNTGAFKAAADLYRATGRLNYNDTLDTYFARSDFKELFETDENVFIGSVTYLSTSQDVDVEQCGVLMKCLMKRSEAIAQRAEQSPYLVTDDGGSGSFYKMLDDMRCLTITDFIIYNYEYTTIIENHAHYLMGMNADAINYVTEDSERTFLDDSDKSGILNDPQNDALLIVMLSVLEKSKTG